MLTFTLLATLAAAQEKAPRLIIEARDGKQTAFSAEQLKTMPRQKVSVVDSHSKATQEYEGVLLSVLLAECGVPSGEALKGSELRDYVVAAGADNYRVLFSLLELDPAFQDNKVLVADTMGGKPLDPKHGPLQLIVPQDRRPTRWVRMLAAIRLSQSP